MVDVILPVLNEREALPWVLGRMPEGFRALVIDNGSTDDSAGLARSLGARVVYEPQPGFGAACHTGLLASTTEIVCVMDADASFDPLELPRVAGPVASEAADLVLGAREPTERGAWPAHARMANKALALELRRRTGAKLTDLGPMRAFRRESMLALGVVDRRFGYPLEAVLRADAAGWRITEVAVSYHPRAGRSKVTGTVRGTARAIRDMAGALSA